MKREIKEKIGIAEIIEAKQREQRKLRRLQCFEHGKHTPYPNGFEGRCFNCGLPLSDEMIREDIKFNLMKELRDILIKLEEGWGYWLEKRKNEILGQLKGLN